MANVLVYVDHRDGAVRKVTYEMIAAAKKITAASGGTVEAAVIGSGVGDLASGLGAYGVSKVYTVDSGDLATFASQNFAAAAKAVIDAASPAVVLFPSTSATKDFAPRVAAKCNAGIATDASDVEWNGALKVTRRTYGGKVVSVVEMNSTPSIVLIRANMFAAAEAAGGSAETVAVDAPAFDAKAKVKEVVQSEGAALDVAEANVVVSGGRGMKGPENWNLIEDMAKVLGAATGASRAVVDAGWRPHGEQVGQTGKVVSPNLYFACGISGAIQHLAGMQTSKVIVAINKDPEAPIFKVADYGIVGDVFEVLPPLTAELKAALAD